MTARLLLPVTAALYLAARWTFADVITTADGIAAGATLLALVPLRRTIPSLPLNVSRFLFASLLVAVVTGSLYYYEDVWTRGRTPHQAVVQDEFAYLFQARTFAAGRLAFPSPVDRIRYDAFHILTTPSYAAKYPPGHALLLAPAARVDRPWIAVHAITAIGLAGLGMLARPLLGPIGAPLLVFLFAFSPAMIQVATTYLSQTTYLTACLVFLLALRNWVRTGGPIAGVIAGLALGWAGMTRPFNAVLLLTALALAWIVLRPSSARGLLARVRSAPARAVAPPLTALVVCGAFLLFYNHAVTGSALTMPWSLYAKQAMPGDGLGFANGGSAPPADALNVAKRKWLHDFFLPNRARYTFEYAWTNLWRNTVPLAMREAGAPLLLLLAPAAFAFARTRRSATALAILPVLGHCFYFFYWFPWPRYYHETFPALLAIPVAGLVALTAKAREERLPGILAAGVLVVCVLGYETIRTAELHGRLRAGIARYHGRFADLVAREVTPPAVVFIRYSPRHNSELDLVNNEPDLANAPIVYVHHEPGTNRAFHERNMPDRAPWFFDEEGFSLSPGHGP